MEIENKNKNQIDKYTIQVLVLFINGFPDYSDGYFTHFFVKFSRINEELWSISKLGEGNSIIWDILPKYKIRFATCISIAALAYR